MVVTGDGDTRALDGFDGINDFASFHTSWGVYIFQFRQPCPNGGGGCQSCHGVKQQGTQVGVSLEQLRRSLAQSVLIDGEKLEEFLFVHSFGKEFRFGCACQTVPATFSCDIFVGLACDTFNGTMNGMVFKIVLEIIATFQFESKHEAQHLLERGCFSGLVRAFDDG